MIEGPDTHYAESRSGRVACRAAGRGPLHVLGLVHAFSTVVFTDLVGSTREAARRGDLPWRDLLTTHDALVRQELERCRGREVKSTGDGFLVTFDGPGRAVRFACAARDAVRTLGLDVRVGVHTGEVMLRGRDIGGIAVHIGQRIQAAAEPGEVLVSRTVVDLVAGSHLRFEDRGEQPLEGVPGLWRLFAAEDQPIGR
jgi:class 3 adenylate cyclase